MLRVVLFVAVAARTGAQTLSKQVRAANGTVEVLYPSRANVCGDGEGTIANVMGHSEFSSYRDPRRRGPCVHGPARLVVTVLNGEVTRVRVYVGPVPQRRSDERIINATAADAEAWMTEMLEQANPRVASDLLLPRILVDGAEPWGLFLKLARDDNRPAEFKRSAMMWLSNAVSEHLGILDDVDRTDDDEMRSQAVFIVSQRPRNESIPTLIEFAKTAKHPSARKAAIYWLGQTADPRAVDVYADLLGLR